MNTPTNPTTASLIDAMRAFIAEQAVMCQAGLKAVADGNEETAHACMTAIESQVTAVVNAVRFAGASFGWDDGLWSGLCDPIPNIDTLSDHLDRDGTAFTPEALAELEAKVRAIAADAA